MLRLTKKKKETPVPAEKQLAVVLPLHSPNRSLDFLIELIDKIRPDKAKDIEQAELRFKAVLYQITHERTPLFSLRKALLTQFLKTNIVVALTENGIVSSRGFVQELMGKLKHKILPPLQTPDNFLYVINKIFYKKKDHFWVEGIDKKLWIQFFEMLGIQINLTEPKLIRQLQQSLQLLSYRITTLGLEKEMTHRYENFVDAIYPFLEQNRLVNEYLHLCETGGNEEMQLMLLEDITEALHNCNQSIQWISDQRNVYGTSLSQAYIITRLKQQIDRMFIIVDVLDSNNEFNTERFTDYFTTVVRNEKRKNSIKEFISENTGYLAYQIAEHGGRTGEKFITTTKKEFWMMFVSACGGGIIISFIGIVKNLLGKMAMPPFWSGILYSTNYSLGFILIQDTGSTLATKQPAYTANNVASSLDVQKAGGEPDLRNLAITVAKVSRTQLASFAGNLLIVFPLTYCLAWLYFESTGVKIAEGAAAQKLLTDQQPFHSLAWLYACFTGFFLFASGLVAGYVENYVVYGKITERLGNSSSFKNTFSEKRRYKILHYVQNNLGALIGNISLGFFLGMAGFFGKTFGLPFDIRHITISAANTAIGFFGLDHLVTTKELVYTIIGVFGIGFINFAVSFGLAFIVAVKSRGIHLKDYPEFLGILGRYIKKYPKDFFQAPTNRRVEQLR
ncbi:site-specific recombinase [Ferruginibacter lapsinanis]|uniref:site-specific recombinase n=1 Tax=Ferruginibacter lapsinanis TaxID=563172 RepID=UPI001E5A99A5|nr:site-specific recombinase [Ferruginibacter lapsinanis]UEG49842.1 site-specific recombinase [Ferruginibacter lapsinanis]